MTGIVPLSGSQQFDVATTPPAFLNGGLLYVYNAGTSTPANAYQNVGLTTLHPIPIKLNAAGRIPAIYLADGSSVRLRLLNSANVLQFDDDNIPVVVAPTASTPVVVTPPQLWATGDVKVRYDDQPVDGYVRANGRTMGSASSGAAERANADCEGLFKFLWGFANISVVTGKGASAAADWSANKQLTLPDMAGRLIGARDDLGNGAASRITGSTVTNPTLAGSSGGEQTHTLITAELAAHTHASPALTDPGHTHPYTNPTIGANQNAGGATGTNTQTPAVNGGTTQSNVTGITLAANTGSNGSDAAHNNMPPVMLFTVYIKL